MSLRVQCPSCKAQLNTSEEQRGKLIKCGKCATTFRLAAAKPSSAPAATAAQQPTPPAARPPAPAAPTPTSAAAPTPPRPAPPKQAPPVAPPARPVGAPPARPVGAPPVAGRAKPGAEVPAAIPVAQAIQARPGQVPPPVTEEDIPEVILVAEAAGPASGDRATTADDFAADFSTDRPRRRPDGERGRGRDRDRGRGRRDREDSEDRPAAANKAAWVVGGVSAGVLALLGLVLGGVWMLAGGPRTQSGGPSAKHAPFHPPVEQPVADPNLPPNGDLPGPQPPFADPGGQPPGAGPGAQPPFTGPGPRTPFAGPDPNPWGNELPPQPLPPKEPWPNPPRPNPLPDQPESPPVAQKVVIPAPDLTRLEMPAAPITGDQLVAKLPGTVEDLAVGGGGRYLLLYLPRLRQIAQFDVAQAKVVHYYPVADDGVKFAAGMDKLVMVFPATKVIQRWDLATHAKEVTAPLAVDGTVTLVAMGSASNGPVYLLAQRDRFSGASPVLDLTTLRPIELPPPAGGRGRGLDGDRWRVSADGRVVASWRTHSSPSGLSVQAFYGDRLESYYEHDSVGHITPGPDGRYLFTALGMYTAEGKKVPGGAQGYLIPSHHGNYYIRVNPNDNVYHTDAVKLLTVHLVGDSRPLVSVGDVAATEVNKFDREPIGVDQRIHLVPNAKALVVLPKTNDQLVLYPFDLDAALDKSGIDYLLVTSQPPPARRGSRYEYQLQVKSKRGGVKCGLASGPDGMTISRSGKVVWAVPQGQVGTPSVIVTVSDASGQEVFHSFDLAVFAADPDAPAVPPQLPEAEPDPEPAVPPVAQAPAVSPPDLKALEIRPPQLGGDTVTVNLPAPVADLCVGGGGRFLILSLPKLRQLALFDVNEAKVVHYFPVADDPAYFAAGIDKLVVAFPRNNVVQRWDLLTRRKELTVPLDAAGSISGVTMGSASRGPLLFCVAQDRGGRPQLHDLMTLRKLDDPTGQGRRGCAPGLVRASADGRLFGFRNDVGGEPHTCSSLLVQGGSATLKEVWIPGSLVIPAHDGRFLYTAAGVYNGDFQKVLPQQERQVTNQPYLPATGADYFLQLQPEGDSGKGTATVYLPGNDRPLAQVQLAEGVHPEGIAYGTARDPIHYDKRLHFIPDAGLLITVPTGNDRLVLRRFDIDEALDKSGVDYLVVTSRPPSAVRRGGKLNYRLVVKSKKGGVRCRLDSGPEGMKLSADNVLTWAVPAGHAQDEATVIITVADATGQEVYHTFRLAVSDDAPDAGPADGPQPQAPEPEAPEVGPEPGPPAQPKAEPAAAPVVRPAPLKEDRVEVRLPSTVADACVGGGGRYFILYLPQASQLAVFDVNEAKVVKYLPLAGDGVKIAAGLNKVYAVYADKGILQRFSLDTFEKEATLQLPVNGSVRAVATGSAANGPLLVHYAEGQDALGAAPVTFLDRVTLKELDLAGRTRLPRHSVRDAYHYRAGPDGTVFGGWVTSHSQSMSSIVLSGGGVKVYGGEMAGSVVPAADNTLVTAGGLYTPECKKLPGDQAQPPYRLRVPAQTGRFYLTCPGGGGAQINTGTDAGKPTTVYLAGDSRPLAELPGVELPTSNEAWTGGDFTQDKRVLFAPEGKLIAVIPNTNDRLVLHRFDVDAALDKSGIDYLFVHSRPPAVARRGARLDYRIAARSKKGGVQYRLDAGPPGMAVAADGRLTWAVPADFAGAEVNVIVTVSDAGGQEVFHTFELRVED